MSKKWYTSKLKKLRERKIIQGVRLQLDLTKIGYNFAQYEVKLSENTKNMRDKLQKFAKLNSSINGLVFGLSKYNCFFQIAYKNQSELKQTIDEIEKKFFISESNLLLVGEESIANTLPR